MSSLIVLDASAILALLRGEPGADLVQAHLAAGIVSSVNYAEVVGHYARQGAAVEAIEAMLASLSLETVPVDRIVARDAGMMRQLSDRAGLSLGDRICLSLAKNRQIPALTADRAWQAIAEELGIEVSLIR